MKYRSGYKYQLVETIYYETKIKGYLFKTKFIDLDLDGLLTIRGGYCWDGPSGPTIDTDNFMLGSLIHDALYQLIRRGHLPSTYRLRCDDILQEICLDEGMCKFRAWYVYKGVRYFGGSAIKKVKKIHEV